MGMSFTPRPALESEVRLPHFSEVEMGQGDDLGRGTGDWVGFLHLGVGIGGARICLLASGDPQSQPPAPCPWARLETLHAESGGLGTGLLWDQHSPVCTVESLTGRP